MAHLVIKEGTHSGQTHEIPPGECVLGRGQQCGIRISDPSVSRVHATIMPQPDGSYLIKDNGSSHGTFVNDKKVAAQKLENGSLVKIGATVMEFRLAEEPLAEEMEISDQDGRFTILHVLTDDTIGDEETAEVRGERRKLRRSSDADNVQELLLTNKRLLTAYEISDVIFSTFDLDQLYRKILEAIFSAVRVERAGILLADEETGEVAAKASMDSFGVEQEVPYSRTIVKKVIGTGKSLLFSNAQEEETLHAAKSVFTHDIRSAMCVPIRTRDKIIGAINADATGISMFTKEDLQLFTLIGNQAGAVIHNARLVEENVKAAHLAAVGQTVASLAHCIKNILTGLKGGSFMVDEGLRTGVRELLEAGWPLVKDSQQRISELAMNMLDFSKERAPAYERASLREHMESIRDIMTDRGKEKGVRIRLDYGEATPKVECDPLAVYRAALNLVTNAIDACPGEDGKVLLRVKPAEDGRHVLISVQDNGGGIPPDVKDKLFQAFHSTKSSKGTGLGLAVTKKIVDEHKGRIHVKTKPDKGTVFTIELPVDRPA